MIKLLIRALALIAILGSCSNSKIDRYGLVTRHNILITAPDSLNSLSVGNGRFAFTVDITGLQTFPDFYSGGIPLGTMSEWGWHSEPNIKGYKLSDVYKRYNVHGREIDYVHRYTEKDDTLRTGASEYLRRNPYRVHLGIIGFELSDEDDYQMIMRKIKDPVQKLNLWTGEINSAFRIDDKAVKVITVCNPELDMISSRISSSLLGEGSLRIKIHFPDGKDSPSGFGFNYPGKHSTDVISETEERVILKRQMDQDYYFITIFKDRSAVISRESNSWYLQAQPSDSVMQFSCLFSKEMPDLSSASFQETREMNSYSWKKFWQTGGAVDFSGSSDARASELERRVILSRYLTKIQCSGSLPPAETGLTYNSWYGKFHLEMHWWHASNFVFWHNEDILENQMDYYFRIYDKARETARLQGYLGVRWPKMTDPEGNESPSNIGTYLIWQQPHFIYFAELLYQNTTDKTKILSEYKDLVFSTADFMASYAWFDSTQNRYLLGPVLISAQESLRLETTVNPTFELAYWYWGLKTALEWKRRAGEKENEKWKDVIEKLSPLPVMNEVYLCSEDTRDTWTNPRYMSDHPIVSGVLGMIPETGLVDKLILGRTLDTIQGKWNWDSCWGWDFPLLAMSAAAINRPEQAIDFLMMEAPKNTYLANGHNWQDARLSVYLPGNGGLLSAVAMMCTNDRFPKNGKWKVRWENLHSIQ